MIIAEIQACGNVTPPCRGERRAVAGATKCSLSGRDRPSLMAKTSLWIRA